MMIIRRIFLLQARCSRASLVLYFAFQFLTDLGGGGGWSVVICEGHPLTPRKYDGTYSEQPGPPAPTFTDLHVRQHRNRHHHRKQQRSERLQDDSRTITDDLEEICEIDGIDVRDGKDPSVGNEDLIDETPGQDEADFIEKINNANRTDIALEAIEANENNGGTEGVDEDIDYLYEDSIPKFDSDEAHVEDAWEDLQSEYERKDEVSDPGSRGGAHWSEAHRSLFSSKGNINLPLGAVGMLTVESVPVPVFTERLRYATSYRDVMRVFLRSTVPLRDEDIDTFLTAQLASERHGDAMAQYVTSSEHENNQNVVSLRVETLKQHELESSARFLTSSRDTYSDYVIEDFDYSAPYLISSETVISQNKYKSLLRHSVGRGISVRSMDSAEAIEDAPEESDAAETQLQDMESALTHYQEMQEQAECNFPAPEVVHIRQFYRRTNRQYLPDCTVLHRCRRELGCCNATSECDVSASNVITRSFWVKVTPLCMLLPFCVKELEYELLPNGTELIKPTPSVKTLTFVNHTECACRLTRQHLRSSACQSCPWPLELMDPDEPESPPSPRCTCRCRPGALDTCMAVLDGHLPLRAAEAACVRESRCEKPTCLFGQFDVISSYCPCLGGGGGDDIACQEARSAWTLSVPEDGLGEGAAAQRTTESAANIYGKMNEEEDAMIGRSGEGTTPRLNFYSDQLPVELQDSSTNSMLNDSGSTLIAGNNGFHNASAAISYAADDSGNRAVEGTSTLNIADIEVVSRFREVAGVTDGFSDVAGITNISRVTEYIGGIQTSNIDSGSQTTEVVTLSNFFEYTTDDGRSLTPPQTRLDTSREQPYSTTRLMGNNMTSMALHDLVTTTGHEAARTWHRITRSRLLTTPGLTSANVMQGIIGNRGSTTDEEENTTSREQNLITRE